MTDHNDEAMASLPPVWLLVLVQAVVSAASLVVEIVAGRMLAPWLGMSLYTWTSIIAVVLAGFSVGHWVGGIFAGWRMRSALAATAWALAGAALTSGIAVFLLRWLAAPAIAALDNPLAAIIVLTMLAFFLPSFFAGIPAPVLTQVAVKAAPARSGRALGAMFAAGAFGAIGGTLAAGFIFISWLGTTATLAIIACLYSVLAAILFLHAGRMAAHSGAMTALVLVICVLPTTGSLALPDPCLSESRYFCIRVEDVSADTGEPTRLMVLDHLAHGVSVRDTPARMVTPHAALLDALPRARFEGKPFSAFFIGGGSFTIPRAWAASGISADMTIAEIDPEVTRIATEHFWFDPATARVLDMDARLALNAANRTFDVIVGDAFTDIAVPAHLVTREFFALVRERLSEDGIYVMNVVDHLDRMRALAAMARTLKSVFPVVEVWAEATRPEPGARVTFILLAGKSETPAARVTGAPPDSMQFGRLSARVVEALIERTGVPVMTDDLAPIDRLMGRLD
ncbi:MAG: fused MFS/spermidine synthase [Zhengella sp.]|uniref:fused MFS/spermidine synthase n=1 Tax=Zhengella sp. TaxID=2282762 RepID=UPI00352862BA|nr:fused MFS/spermidine synthase [Brucellaceae bacterium]